MVAPMMVEETFQNEYKTEMTPCERMCNTNDSTGSTKITLAFVFKTKIHGLKHIFAPEKSKPQRLTWFLALSICLVLLFIWSWKCVFYFLSYPAVTKIYMVWSTNMTFPAITFCNQNLFRVSSLTKADLYHSGYWMDIMHLNHTVNRQSAAMLKHSRHRDRMMRLLNFSDYSPPPNFQLNTTEMIDRLSHQLEDMLLECKFRGENCTYKNFTSVCTLVCMLAVILLVVWLLHMPEVQRAYVVFFLVGHCACRTWRLFG